MGMINGLRILNALTQGTLSGAQLTTLLASGINLGSFNQLLRRRSQMDILSASGPAMTAVANSATAMTALVASSVAMSYVTQSSAAVAAIAADPVGNNAILASAFSVGAYLDRLRTNAGSSSDATLIAASTLTQVAASGAMTTTVINSSAALGAVTSSQNAMAIYSSAAGATGFNTMVASPIAMLSITSSNTAVTAINANGSGYVASLAAVLASSYYVGAFMDRLQVIGGGATNATLAALQTRTDIKANASAINTINASANLTAAILRDTSTTTALAQSTTFMPLLAASAAAVALWSASTAGNSSVLGSATVSVGAYLDRVRIIGGAATDATLAALNTFANVYGNATAVIAVHGSNAATSLVAVYSSTWYSNCGAVGAYLNRISIANGGATDATLAAQTTIAAVLANGTAMIAVTASPKVCSYLNTWDPTTVWAGTLSIGKYFDQLQILAGGTTDASISAAASIATICASSPMMTTVWASNFMTDVMLSHTVPRLAVYSANVALTALQANPTQIQRLRAAASAFSISSLQNVQNSDVYNSTQKFIVLRMIFEYDNSGNGTNWQPQAAGFGRQWRASSNGGSAQFGGPSGRTITTDASGSVSGSYAASGSWGLDDVSSNLVCTSPGGFFRGTYTYGSSSYRDRLFAITV